MATLTTQVEVIEVLAELAGLNEVHARIEKDIENWKIRAEQDHRKVVEKVAEFRKYCWIVDALWAVACIASLCLITWDMPLWLMFLHSIGFLALCIGCYRSKLKNPMLIYPFYRVYCERYHRQIDQLTEEYERSLRKVQRGIEFDLAMYTDDLSALNENTPAN